MKSSTQLFASPVAALATFSQSEIARPNRLTTQNSIGSYQLIGKKLSLSNKIELQPPSLVEKQNRGERVLMIDWGEAVMNDGNSNPGVPFTNWRLSNAHMGVYYAAKWIRPISEVVVSKLKKDYGLTSKEANQNLNIISHNLVTLMVAKIGAVYAGLNLYNQREISELHINSIIALDHVKIVLKRIGLSENILLLI
jgi:hypothetical protein